MQKDLIYINMGTKELIDSTGAPIRVTAQYPVIERGQWQILCIQFVNILMDDIGLYTVNNADISGASYVFLADSDFKDEDDVMLKSVQSTTAFNETDPASNRINIEGDWIDGTTADPAKGQMSIRIYSNTEKYTQVLNSNLDGKPISKFKVTSNLYATVKQYVAGVSTPSSIAWFPFIAQNTIKDQVDAFEIPPSEAETMITSSVGAYMAQPTYYQFSVDGTSWHTTQTSDDIYYRMRIGNSAWGSAVKMLAGPAGSSFRPDAFGTTAERAQYDSEKKGFLYLATDTGIMYSKLSDTSGDWDNGFQFKGDPGSQGAPGKDAPLTDYNPVLSPTFRDATNGRYCRLDNEFQEITVAENIIDAVSMRFHIKSADSSVSGDINMTVTINTGSVTHDVPVDAVGTWIEMNLPDADGIMTITRNPTASTDTLKSGGTVVSALIDAVEITYER